MSRMDPRFEKLYQLALDEIENNIMPFWIEKTQDREFGGFYGACGDDGTPVEKASKCLILCARLIWSFASAYRVLKKPEYLEMAKRAYDYFVEHFVDRENGGVYYMVDYKGEPEDRKKLVYGEAFAIYAFSEYCRATGDTRALDEALSIFELLEKHAYDAKNKGYWELYTPQWEKMDSKESRVSHGDATTKTMNTHLHLIEAYTCLLRVWKNDRMQDKVREHLDVMLDRIVNQEIGHYIMFLDDLWNPTSQDVSPGHDIEGTWLMMETAEVLGEEAMVEKAKPICLKMAAACLEEDVLPDGSMVYEVKAGEDRPLTNRSWWVQAETVVGFLNAWELSGEDRFLDASLKAMEFIREHVVDHIHGEWFPMLGDDLKPVASNEQKVSGWKAPYHNSRMCLEIIERYRKHAKA